MNNLSDTEAGPLNIMLVEDDEVDRMAIKRAFKRQDIPVQFVEAHNGREALDILYGKSEVAPPPDPFLVLLDINMPQMDGIEMLRHLRSQSTEPRLRDAIVFILTTSEAENDRERAYSHNVAGYLVKSAEHGGLLGIAKMLKAYRELVVFP